MDDDFLTIEEFVKNNFDKLQRLIKQDKIFRWFLVVMTLLFSAFFIWKAETLFQLIVIPIWISTMIITFYFLLWRNSSFIPTYNSLQENKYVTIRGGIPVIIENYDGIIKIPEGKCVVIENGTLIYGYTPEQIEKTEDNKNLLIYNDIFARISGEAVIYPSKKFFGDMMSKVKLIG